MRGISKKSLPYINGDLRQIGFREIFVLIVAYDNESIWCYLFELMSQTLEAVTDLRIATLEILDRFQRNLDCAPPTGEFSSRFEGGATGSFCC